MFAAQAELAISFHPWRATQEFTDAIKKGDFYNTPRKLQPEILIA